MRILTISGNGDKKIGLLLTIALQRVPVNINYPYTAVFLDSKLFK